MVTLAANGNNRPDDLSRRRIQIFDFLKFADLEQFSFLRTIGTDVIAGEFHCWLHWNPRPSPPLLIDDNPVTSRVRPTRSNGGAN